MNKKITIMGLGSHGGGISSARFFARAGARITVTDLKTEKELKSSIARLARYKNITFILGRHRASDFNGADLIIRNPAVPHTNNYLEKARDAGIPVHTDVSWFLDLLRNNHNITVIGITGTKGKSSTSALLHRILEQCGKKAILAGNIRKSPLDFLVIKNCRDAHARLSADSVKLIGSPQFIILELSSWHIESLYEHKISPQIALITNVLPDHLNRHNNFSEYGAVKFSIAANQKKTDALFINSRDPVSRALAKKHKNSRIVWFGKNTNTTKLENAAAHPDAINAAMELARFLKLPSQKTRRAIQSFPGLHGRLEFIAEKRKVRYYNDTCATMPDATAYAIQTIQTQNQNSAIILIAGGSDKGLDYAPLARVIKKHCARTIIYKGAPTDYASDKLLVELLKIGAKNIYSEKTLKGCVAIAKQYAAKGDVVLFSPAASSFGRFKHEFDRGEKFKKAVQDIEPV